MLALAVVGLAAAWLLRGSVDLGWLQETLRHNRLAPLLFLLIHIVASLLFLPRSVMAIAAGLIFGAWWGGLLAAAGSVVGAAAGFLIARYLASGIFSLGEIPRLGSIARWIELGGWRAVATLRLVPVLPHTAVNYALGLTDIGLGAYVLGSFVGQLPLTVAFVQFGSASDHLLDGRPDWIIPSMVGVVILLISSALPRLLPSRSPVRTRSGTRGR